MEPRAPRNALESILTVAQGADGGATVSLESFWGGVVAGDLLARAVLVAQQGKDRGIGSTHVSVAALPTPADVVSLVRQELGADRVFVQARSGDQVWADIVVQLATAPTHGPTYQARALPSDLADPDSLPSEVETARLEGWEAYAVGPLETRRTGEWRAALQPDQPAVWTGWLRPREPLGADPALHMAALAFVTEYRSHWAIERRLGERFSGATLELLDHASWVHRARPFTDWWFVRTESDVAVEGHCLSSREIFDRDGLLLASAQWMTRVTL